MSNTKRIIFNAYTKLINDEELLRLLYYPPADLSKDIVDPLSPTLENVLDKDIDEYWEIVNKHVLRTSKSDNLETDRLCRIYVYAGKKRGITKNFKVGKREIVFDILVHNDFETDMRVSRISDRLSDIFFNSRLDGGLGVVDYRDGYDFSAPKGYEAYRHIYIVGESK